MSRRYDWDAVPQPGHERVFWHGAMIGAVIEATLVLSLSAVLWLVLP